MVRKLMLAAAGSLAFCSTAFGLGLGDLQLKSSLNQTFNASIDLRDVDGLNPDEVIVRLATAEDFGRAGMERSAYLLDFRFNVQIGPDGRGQIRVTSVRPLTEPFVEFLVSVAWPTGRMQRQYTVLLDPPRNEVLRPSEVVAPSSSSRRPPSPPRERELAADSPRRPEAGAPAPGFDGSEYGPTTSRDTAWRVAERVQPSGDVTVRQTLLALLRLNPQAFIGDNVNRLKAGQTLRTPSVEQARQASDAEAGREIARQTRDWRGERAPRPAAADTGSPITSAPVAAAAPAPAPPRDEVRIVTPAAPTGARPAPAPGSELAGSEEERDRLSRELNQAGTSIAALQQQTAALNNQIAARDQQIADLQRQMAELKSGQPAVAPGGGLFDSWLGKGLLIGFGVLLIAALALLNMWDRWRKRALQAERDKAATDERLERTVRMERERTGNTQRGGIIAPTTAAATVAVAQSSGRGAPARAARPEPSLDLTSDGLSSTAEVRSEFDRTVILADPGAEARRASGPAHATVTETPASDVVSEADIYIAYGRFPQAISFLQSALEKEPNRNDARLKLMEAYAETRDAAGFQLEAQQLLSRSPSEADLRRARQLQARLPGVVAIPSEPLPDQDADFDKTIIDASMADQALQETLNSAAVELDLDLDRTELLADIDAPKPLDLDLSTDLPGDSGKLDFDLTLDGLDPTPLDDRGQQLGGDLGLQFRDDDFDPERTASITSADDDAGFDLTLDGRGAAVAPVRRVSAPQPDDDSGLSLTLDSGDDIAPALRNDDISGLDTIEGSPVDDDLEDFLAGDTDAARTKLDLARAYIDMGDEDGARDLLNEVVVEGSDGQKQEARELIARLS